MTQESIIGFGQQAVLMMLLLGGPILAVSLVVGLLVSIFQAITQIQEMTLAFIPKIVAIGLVLVIAGPWMLGQIVSYTEQLYGGIPGLVGP